MTNSTIATPSTEITPLLTPATLLRTHARDHHREREPRAADARGSRHRERGEHHGGHCGEAHDQRREARAACADKPGEGDFVQPLLADPRRALPAGS